MKFYHLRKTNMKIINKNTAVKDFFFPVMNYFENYFFLNELKTNIKMLC